MKTSFNKGTKTYSLEIDLKELTLIQSALSFTQRKLEEIMDSTDIKTLISTEKCFELWEELDFLLSDYESEINL